MRHVVEIMGTVASIELPPGWPIAPLVAIFESIDQQFSLYRADSELSRIAAGKIRLPDARQPLRETYARSLLWRNATGGLFSPHRPDGVLDLNGIVKAEAIESAGAYLLAAECPSWAINIGGDILVSRPHEVVGIADPAAGSTLLCSLTLAGSRRAVATSGSAQRGDHIWLGGALRPAEFTQVSVVADDIVTADILATAIVAGGPTALDELTERWDVDVLTVDRGGDLRATPGLLHSLAA
ncbi:MAG: FAD:protein FMN transferase [Microbacteriaceae bacterium]